MSKALALLLALSVLPTLHCAPYPNRFVWVFGWGLRDGEDLGQIQRVLETAAQHGLDGRHGTIPNLRGLMCTPWLRKYALLPEFGDLLRNENPTTHP